MIRRSIRSSAVVPVAMTALLIGYPIVVHISVVLDSPNWGIGALLILSSLVCFALARSRRRTWLFAFVVLAMAGMVVGGRDLAEELTLAAPVLINVALFVIFGRTLLDGRVPLVTQFETLMNGEPDQTLRDYTRRVTQWWVVFFAIMTLECILLALFAPPYIWSLFTNSLNYVAVGLMFVIEYQVRIRTLPERTHPGLLSFCRKLVAVVSRSR